jgi:PTH2 family peptidyl-tRNA hydrolase
LQITKLTEEHMDEKQQETDFKQILVVRKDLNMRKGKIAAQAAHASMATLTRGPGAFISHESGRPELVVPLDDDAYAWLTGRFRKICVYVTSEAELLELHDKAVAAGMRCSLIQDSGVTEFGGVPTYTVVAIGPHSNERLAGLTDGLPLL